MLKSPRGSSETALNSQWSEIRNLAQISFISCIAIHCMIHYEPAGLRRGVVVSLLWPACHGLGQ